MWLHHRYDVLHLSFWVVHVRQHVPYRWRRWFDDHIAIVEGRHDERNCGVASLVTDEACSREREVSALDQGDGRPSVHHFQMRSPFFEYGPKTARARAVPTGTS